MPNHNKNNIVLILSCLIFFILTDYQAGFGGINISKSGTTAASILDIPMSPRGLAMGSAVIANLPDGATFSWNPALASQYRHLQISLMNMPWLVDTKINHFSVIAPTTYGIVGVYLSTWSMGDVIVRNEYYQEGTGEKFSADDMVIGLAVARNLTDHFAIGGTVKYIQERIWHTSASGWAVDFGTLFKIDIGNGLRIGTTLANYGTEMKMAGRDLYHYHDPNETMDGNNENIISSYETNSWPLPLTFKIGLSTDIVAKSNLKWIVEMDAVNPSNNYGSLGLGTEITFGKWLALRVGAERLFLRDENVSFGAGFGLNLPPLSSFNANFSYGFRNYNELGIVHGFSMEFGF